MYSRSGWLWAGCSKLEHRLGPPLAQNRESERATLTLPPLQTLWRVCSRYPCLCRPCFCFPEPQAPLRPDHWSIDRLRPFEDLLIFSSSPSPGTSGPAESEKFHGQSPAHAGQSPIGCALPWTTSILGHPGWNQISPVCPLHWQGKNISQIGSFRQVGVKINDLWNHHLDWVIICYLPPIKGTRKLGNSIETWVPMEWIYFFHSSKLFRRILMRDASFEDTKRLVNHTLVIRKPWNLRKINGAQTPCSLQNSLETTLQSSTFYDVLRCIVG